MTEVQKLLDKIKFGTKDERFQALVALGEREEINLEVISPTLYSVMEKTEDFNEMAYAGIALARQGDKTEKLRNWLLDTIKMFANNHENCTPLGLLESHITKALSMYKGDKIVSNGLIDVVQNCSTEDNSRMMIKPCFRAIGAIGDNTTIDFLEYWKKKGNVSAMAALELFGSSWKDIFEKEKQY